MNASNGTTAHGNGVKTSARETNGSSPLVAAYREGLGLAPVTVIEGPSGIRIAVAELGDGDAPKAAETVRARWWCRRPAQAERVAASANARLRRGKSRHGEIGAPLPDAPHGDDGGSTQMLLARESIIKAAAQYDVVLQSDDELFEEAAGVIARIDGEMERLQRLGELKSINKSYQKYRIEATQRGESVRPYQHWMGRYKENLVRELASTLRYL